MVDGVTLAPFPSDPQQVRYDSSKNEQLLHTLGYPMVFQKHVEKILSFHTACWVLMCFFSGREVSYQFAQVVTYRAMFGSRVLCSWAKVDVFEFHSRLLTFQSNQSICKLEIEQF